jgi:hypothetical protein
MTLFIYFSWGQIEAVWWTIQFLDQKRALNTSQFTSQPSVMYLIDNNRFSPELNESSVMN